MRCVPKINGVYWLCLVFASLFGDCLSGLLEEAFGLSHLVELAVLAVVLVAVFVGARLLKHVSALYFWASLVLIRAAATNVANAFHDYQIKFITSVPILCLVLAFMVIVWRSRTPSMQEQDYIPVTSYYWVTMLVACVLGTLAGDAATYILGYGFVGTIIAFAIPLAFLMFIGRDGLYADLGFYWFTVMCIAATGAAAGELLTHHALHNAEISTAITGVVFAALIAAIYETRKGSQRLQALPAADPAP